MPLATLVQSTSPAAGLDVSVTVEATDTVVMVRGEADVSTLPLLVEALDGIIADQEGDVIVDLAPTEFIDTAALRAVLRAKEVLGRSGRQLTLRAPSRIATRLLTVYGLLGLVRSEPAVRK